MDCEPHDFVCYRLPEASRYTMMAQTAGEPMEVGSVAGLGAQPGFVVAPFVATAPHPILLLRPDVVEGHEVGAAEAIDDGDHGMGESPREKAAYAADFDCFHREVCSGRVAKLVLSRRTVIDGAAAAGPMELFHRACRRYPHQFIALVSLRRAGTWLMATPEVLLDGHGGQWHTMALAGTMRRPCAQPDLTAVVWSDKNMTEQRYVSQYIKGVLGRLADGITARGPYTTMAAHLLHLRTDFTFRLKEGQSVGALLDALHPTPAVCGMPKDAARRFILDSETVDRKYYSGFCGPLGWQGETHLYVSLRCMELTDGMPRLYAGGGIMPDSRMESEWQETQSKLQTMRRLLTL